MTAHDFSLLNTVTDIKETATAVNFTMMKLIGLREENAGSPIRTHPAGD